MPSMPRPSTLAPVAPRRPPTPKPGRRGFRPKPPRALLAPVSTTPAPASASAGVGSFSGGDTQRLLDLRDDAGFRFEEFLVHLAPATERFDREQAGRRWEAARAGHARDHRSIALLHPNLLAGGGEQVVDELLSLRRAADDGDRVLDQDRVLGDHVFDRRALLLIGDRLVLVVDQGVAAAGEEGLQRVARRAVLADDVVEQRLQVFLGLRRRLAFLE